MEAFRPERFFSNLIKNKHQIIEHPRQKSVLTVLSKILTKLSGDESTDEKEKWDECQLWIHERNHPFILPKRMRMLWIIAD